ncbi:hypothetical protein BOTNAR_0273g00140 [Botryotinia narcissicola]|uniref:Uncharacterized protein n=1 Tax=Botryotinia narcissicola TaxID=278944 RepID=A0A4Z1HYV0_9HELO|nr:hypothetical protein BOTNAR_0273g00140 [Botryotinia narcissicola]
MADIKTVMLMTDFRFKEEANLCTFKENFHILYRSAGIPRYLDLEGKLSIPATISDALPPAKAENLAIWHAGLKAWQKHNRG